MNDELGRIGIEYNPRYLTRDAGERHKSLSQKKNKQTDVRERDKERKRRIRDN
jgi:hypothetical protein